MNSLKKVKVIITLTIFVFIGIAAIKQPVNDNFKNLQVLPKNISNDSLNLIMDQFNIALGVDCGYCHFKDKKADTLIFDKDDRAEKEIARKMMLMTVDINKNYFHFNENIPADQVQAVTCITCHRGTPMPDDRISK